MDSPVLVLLIVLTIEVLTIGCGANVSESGAGGAAAPASGAAPSVADTGIPRKNACEFVNRGEVEAIVGKSVTLLHNVESDTETACELSDAANSKTTLVVVTVVWKGGKAEADAERAALGMAKSLMNEKDVDIEALTSSGGVAGLADAAYYSNVMPSWLLKGDVLIKVIAPTSPGDQTRRVFLSVAKTALAKLKE